ncbi:MAG TPA: transglutaminase-like domain-containing protein [Lacipirellulaceae bacterium]|nr:transglutaminase-like domain-containing protein [Lacipirellulaceae bacterium]
MPAYCRAAAFDAFAREMPRIDSTAGLFRAAFAISRHEQPEADLGEAEATIAELAATVQRRVHSPSIEAKLAHLHDVMFDVVGFIGNVKDYYNPANSYLPKVLRTHRGLPITLVLIYKCVAERVGLDVRGINSPGHFLAAVRDTESSSAPTNDLCWMYVDPFYGGELLDHTDVCRRIAETTGLIPVNSTDWLSPATHRQWLGRMLNNLQAIFAHTGRERDLYAMQELQNLL